MSPLAKRLALTFALLASAPLAAGQILFGPAKVTKPSPTVDTYTAIDCADVDGDGLLDLVRSADLNVRWHQGDGTGGFAVTGTLLPGVSANRLRLVDLNGDGRRDLLALTFSTATLQVAMADPVSGFDPPVEYATPPSPLAKLALAAGDADADGDADVLLVARGTLGDDPGEAWLLLNDGAGALALGPIVSGDSTHLLDDGLVVSVDGDEWPDLVLTSNSSGQPPETDVWQGQPGGGMEVSFRVQGHRVTCAADLDSDGDVDLADSTNSFLVPVLVSTFLGDGRGDFVAGPVTDVQLNFLGIVDIELATSTTTARRTSSWECRSMAASGTSPATGPAASASPTRT